LVIESLSRCDAWAASGGKSKSHFYKTKGNQKVDVQWINFNIDFFLKTKKKDDRLVVKQMVNAWNIAEKDAFLKFAPKYFEHMSQSSNVRLPIVLFYATVLIVSIFS
jgi:hypothetical protein